MHQQVTQLKIVNLTPHDVVVRIGSVDITFRSEGVARVASSSELIAKLAVLTVEIPVVRAQFGETTGLPAVENGTFLIVSMIVAQANTDRADLIVPDTSPQGAIRNNLGQIEAVRGFQSFSSDDILKYFGTGISHPPSGYQTVFLVSKWASDAASDGKDEQFFVALPRNLVGWARSLDLFHGVYAKSKGWMELRDAGALVWSDGKWEEIVLD